MSKMMENCPRKFRLMEVLDENGQMWTNEIVPMVQKEYGMNSDHGRDMINYDLVEMVSAGFVKEGDSVLDEEGKFKKGHLLTQYSLTKLGKSTLEDLKSKVKPQVK